MRFIDRSARNKVHGLDQDTTNLVFDDKICQSISNAFTVIVRADDEQAANTKSVLLDVFDRLLNLGLGAGLVIRFEGLVL